MGGGFPRTVNILKTGHAYARSSLSGRPFISGMPPAAGIELTNRCNLACPECACGSGQMTRPAGFMDLRLYDRILSELSPWLLYVNLYFQGESMLHPEFFSFIRPDTGIYFTLSTNGHFLGDGNAHRLAASGLKKLIVSLDGMDQETYSYYRVGGELRKVVRGIAEVAEAREKLRSPLKLEIQFLVNRLNEHQVPRVKKFAREVKAALNLKSMQVINPSETAFWMPSEMKFRRYEAEDGKFMIRNSFPNRCARLWFNPVITWDGKVLPCCFDKNADHVMGDLANDSFREIWEGPRYNSFRQSVLTAR
nr:radical SAM protein [Bacteroidales bacterium]